MLMGEEPNPIEKLLNYNNVGRFGKYLTEYSLGKDSIPGYRRIKSNVYVPNRNGTTEIDVVMIHEKGTFVIESKNYSGWIFGSEEQHNWIQRMQNGEKYQFYNPIKQNATHCKAISDFLGIDKSNVYSYIVFSEQCKLKKVPVDTLNYTILQRSDFLRVLRRDLDIKNVIFTPEYIDSRFIKLEAISNVLLEQKQAHVKTVNEIKNGTICPFCGATLVKRKGNYGEFLGCTTYPKCKFTRKI